MKADFFRVDFFRLPFVVLFAAVAAWLVINSRQAGALVAVMALGPLVLGVAIAWFFGTIQIGPEGLVLYRTHKVQWAEVTKVEAATILWLPYLRVWRNSGMAWFVPLHVRGSRSIEESLEKWAPPGSLFVAVLTRHGSGSGAP